MLGLGLAGAGLFLPFEAVPLASFAAARSLQPPGRAPAKVGGPPVAVGIGARVGVAVAGGDAVAAGVVPSAAPRAPGGRYAPPVEGRNAGEPGVGVEAVGVAAPWMRDDRQTFSLSAGGAALA